MKNIFNEIENENSNNNIINNPIFPGLSQYDVLFIGDNIGTVDGLTIGPQNYLLQASNTGPQYTNSINVSDITTTQIKLTGFNNSALITGINGTGEFGQIPLGSQGETLIVFNGSPAWSPNLFYPGANGKSIVYVDTDKQIKQVEPSFCSDFTDNQIYSIGGAPAILISGFHNFTGGKKYRIVFSGMYSCSAGGVIQMEINISQSGDFAPPGVGNLLSGGVSGATNSPFHFERVINVVNSYLSGYSIVASRVGAATLLQPKIIIDEFI
jgi:hypothetical protein